MSATAAAEVAGVHPDTVRRAIRAGALRVVGFVGQRPRLRREDVEAWIAGNEAPWHADQPPERRRRRSARPQQSYPRVLGDVMSRIAGAGR